MEAAFALLDLWMDYMHSTGHVRYAPDFFFVGTGFAGAFLLEVSSFFSPVASLVLTCGLLASQPPHCSDIGCAAAGASHRCM